MPSKPILHIYYIDRPRIYIYISPFLDICCNDCSLPLLFCLIFMRQPRSKKLHSLSYPSTYTHFDDSTFFYHLIIFCINFFFFLIRNLGQIKPYFHHRRYFLLQLSSLLLYNQFLNDARYWSLRYSLNDSHSLACTTAHYVTLPKALTRVKRSIYLNWVFFVYLVRHWTFYYHDIQKKKCFCVKLRDFEYSEFIIINC